MANGKFIALAYAKLNELGIDTTDKSPEDVLKLYSRLDRKQQSAVSKSGAVSGEKDREKQRKITEIVSENKR